jgi:hypothetical protein
MNGYVASARIDRASPRFARPSGADRDTSWQMSVASEVSLDVDERDLAGSTGSFERLAAIRERWSQLTFFLFDPNSWR